MIQYKDVCNPTVVLQTVTSVLIMHARAQTHTHTKLTVHAIIPRYLQRKADFIYTTVTTLMIFSKIENNKTAA